MSALVLAFASIVSSSMAWVRLPNPADAPRITTFKLAGGSFNTAERTVRLDFQFDGPAPTLYRASEKSDFAGVLWRKISGTPTVGLSSAPGAKIVFLQLGAPLPGVTGARTETRAGSVTSPVLIPGVVSNIVRDTIILGLPDLRMTVTMPRIIQDGNFRKFEFDVVVKNHGQRTPPDQVITLYNSFVENKLAIERVEVTFGLGRTVGRGCVITDVPTAECDLAPIPPDGGVGIHFTASVNNLLRSGQRSVTHTLRSRILVTIWESNTANNWVDTPLTVIR